MAAILGAEEAVVDDIVAEAGLPVIRSRMTTRRGRSL